MAFVSLPDGYRTFVNKGWVECTGMTVEQSLGSGWHAVIHPGGPEASSRQMGGGAVQRKADALRGPVPACPGRAISLVHGKGGAATGQAREDREMVRYRERYGRSQARRRTSIATGAHQSCKHHGRIELIALARVKAADCGRGDKRSAPRGYSTVITTFALACPSST
jgi:hypothetical protein